MKNIAIIGGGSVGLLFASYLTENFNVTLYTRTAAQAAAITREGIIRTVQEMTYKRHVQAQPLSEGLGKEDLVIVAVKQYHLDNVLATLKTGLDCAIPILFVQNGMGHIHKLESSIHKHIFLGIVEHGALKISPYAICHTGLGVTKISCLRGESVLIQSLMEKSVASFPFQEIKDWKKMLVGKLIVNACINPLTALYREENGQLIEQHFYYENLQIVFNEVVRALHVSNRKDYWDKVVDICRRTALNRSSMLKDIEAGRETEVEAILGYILAEAARNDVPVPLIKFLYNAIKGMETKKGGAL